MGLYGKIVIIYQQLKLNHSIKTHQKDEKWPNPHVNQNDQDRR